MSYLEFKVEFNNCMYTRDIKLSTHEYNVLKGYQKISVCQNKKNLILDDDYFDKSSLVSDEARYTIKIKNNICSKPKLLKDFKPIEENKNIVLLLESPHRSEYRDIKIYDRLVPIGPAQGGNLTDAGGAIKAYIHEAINYVIAKNSLSLNNGDYNLIIINPIQFQTSLGSLYNKGLNRNLRNKVWKKIWKIIDSKKCIVQEDFICRLNSYNPDLIINACTYELKKSVKKLLDDKTIISYGINHPAINWNKKKSRF
ncbi:hypothetical protein [uncultured Clostridium sp.]|uniref:hypothetical protein n=1 Tax=uncultured Clostridium sp. TaxID=59620 RepID=UPI0025E39560|nr:hypothetical protein [uncultured Clostridium sp.]